MKKAQLCLFIFMFAVLDFAVGRFGAWWHVAIPAFIVAASRREQVVLAAVIGSLISWFGMGLYFDLPTGFRLSGKITGIIGLHGWALAYLVTGLLVGIIVALAAYAGQNLRAGIRNTSSARRYK